MYRLKDRLIKRREGGRDRRDLEKPWLDDPEFKQLVEEKGLLYSRKVRGVLNDTLGSFFIGSS